MNFLGLVSLFIAITSTLYYINYRILTIIKMFVYKEYLNEQPTETDEEVENFKHSMTKLNGFYRQLDNMETVCYWDMLIMIVSWTTVLYLKMF